MKSLTDDEVRERAQTIFHWAQDAVGDIARDSFSDPDADPAATDSKADSLHNEVELLQDICGNRIFDEGQSDPLTMICIAEEVKLIAHEPLQIAMDNLIKGWEERLK